MKFAHIFWGVVVTAALAMTTPASAHWQFTRWGMTPDQVIKASGGKAAWKAQAGTQVLSMEYPSGQYDLHVSFGFDAQNHLNNVGIGSGTNVYGIINELKDKYGPPAEAAPDDSHYVWYTPEDRITAMNASGGYILLNYWSRTSGGASGL